MEQSTPPKGEKPARQKKPPTYVAVVGISTPDQNFEPGDTVEGLSDDMTHLYLKRGYIKKGKK